MKIYRVHFIGRKLESHGYQFTDNLPAAHAATRNAPKGTTAEIDTLEIPLTRRGLIDGLAPVRQPRQQRVKSGFRAGPDSQFQRESVITRTQLWKNKP